MARTVFLSFLGTGNYQECTYTLQGKESPKVRFIQTALLKLHAPVITDAYIFVTKTAAMKSWLDVESQEGNGWSIGLKSELEARGIPLPEPVTIPDGKNEQEIWTIFQTIFQQLQKGDCVYLDITHGFR